MKDEGSRNSEEVRQETLAPGADPMPAEAQAPRMTLAYHKPYKVCQVCGKVFPDRKTYLMETEPVRGNPDYPEGKMPAEDGDEWYYELRNCSCGATLAEKIRSERDLSPLGRLRRSMFRELWDHYVREKGMSREEAREAVMSRYEAFFRAHLTGHRVDRAGRGPWEQHGPASAELGRLLLSRGIGPNARHEIDDVIWERFGRLAAVMVLDSSGFTRRTKQSGIVSFLALIADLRRRLWSILEAYGATVRKAEADNVLAVFPDAESAVRCAIACQRNAKLTNAGRAEEDVLQICIGVGFGRLLVVGDEDVFGEEVNLASKLGEDVAGPGEILLTESAWRAVQDAFQGFDVEERTLDLAGVRAPYYALDWDLL